LLNIKIKKVTNIKIKMELSVVIPTINSAKHIRNTVSHIDKYLKTKAKKLGIKKYEIVLASQISKDNTFEVVRELARKNRRVKALYLMKAGKGVGLNGGIAKAKYQYILMIDDDLSYPIEFLEKAVKKIKKYSIVIGSRYITKQKIPLKRKIASFGYRMIVKLLFNLPIKDIQSGLKLINKKVFKEIGLPKQQRYVWDTELILKAYKAGFKICEIPINYNFRENVLRIRKAAPQMLKDVLALWLRETFRHD
jgi:glycosyltransferase involved in cell wall biosynthesis